MRANATPGDGELRVGDVDYRLVHFHWHIRQSTKWMACASPMEMHLVHNGTDGSTLVIGVFLRAGSANNRES